MNTGEIIQKFADEQGMNLRQLAIKANIPYSTLHGIVSRNSSKVNSKTLHSIAVALQVPDFMLYSSREETPAPPQAQDDAFNLCNGYIARVAALACVASLYHSSDYSDLPEEQKETVTATLNMFQTVLNNLLHDDISTPTSEAAEAACRYAWPKIVTAFQFTNQNMGKRYKRLVQESAEVLITYAMLNPDGQKDLRKYLNQIVRLDEYKYSE